MELIRVGLIDDHRIFREALRLELLRVPDLAVIGVAANAREALILVEAMRPDVVVLDIGLPDATGAELAVQLRALAPATKIVALSGYADRFFIEAMLQAGAGAYVVKSAGVEDLVAAIRAVLAGKIHLCADARLALQPPAAADCRMLTTRETAVLRCIASGMRTAEIAIMLGISGATVDTHRKNIKAKLGLRTIAELTRYALGEGLLKH